MNIKDESPYKDSLSNFIKDKSDLEVVNFLNQKYEETLNLINNNKHNIEIIKDSLLNKETIYNKDINELIDTSQIHIGFINN